jgi:hypothetical protein
MDSFVNVPDDFAVIRILLDALTSIKNSTDARIAPFYGPSANECADDISIETTKPPCIASKREPEVETVTTIMIRNIPRKCTQRMLVADLTDAGFGETFDFVYLPTDISSAKNLGYAFVNFTHPEYASSFREVFHKKHLSSMRGSRTGLSVSPAVIQGFDANVENVMKNASVHRIRNPEYLPMVVNRETSRLGPCFMHMDIKRRHSNSSQASTASFASMSEWSGIEASVFASNSSELKIH